MVEAAGRVPGAVEDFPCDTDTACQRYSRIYSVLHPYFSVGSSFSRKFEGCVLYENPLQEVDKF